MKFSQPISIVGMGAVFPGASNLFDFWLNVKNAVDVACEVPDRRWLIPLEKAYDEEVAKADHVYSRRGCFIEGFDFDPTGLDLDVDVVSQLDVLFHLILDAGRRAFGDGVTEHLDRDRIKVILGNIALPSEESSRMAREILGSTLVEKNLDTIPSGFTSHPLNRYVAGLPGGLLARGLGLGGGSFTLDAACASSLYALQLAAVDLLAGRVDAVLAGGMSRPDCLYTQMGFGQLRALSPTGTCSPFSRQGNGLVVGEGAGVFLLKRRSDALRDGDRIYGNITAVGLSNDVEGSLLSPSSEGQLRAMTRAYEEAGWRPDEVDLIECHATGTPVGDRVELASLIQLWKKYQSSSDRPCVIGSVKSNIGHLLTGAGAAGMAKVLMAMKEETLPPTANFTGPGDDSPLDESPFEVLTESRPWSRRTESTPRRAGVSAFGFGGINGHVLVEEELEGAPTEEESIEVTSRPRVPVAIVAMDVEVGPWKGLTPFQHRVLGGDQRDLRRPPSRWWGVDESRWWKGAGKKAPRGYYIDEVELPMGEYRIPPVELKDMLPQQSLMLKVACRAWNQLSLEDKVHLQSGVFVGIELDLNTTNFHFRWWVREMAPQWAEELEIREDRRDQWIEDIIGEAGPPLTANRTMGALGGIVASRIARELHLGGAGYTVSSEENSGLQALQVAVRSLENGDLDQALVGAVDLAGDVRATLAQGGISPWSEGGPSHPYGTDSTGAVPSDGAAAVVLKRLEDARRDGDTIYGVIAGVGEANRGGVTSPTSPEAYVKAMERACKDGSIDEATVEYIEGHGTGCPREDQVELEGLAQFFSRRESPPVVGSVKGAVGHTGAAAGLISLVGTCLSLYHQVIPPLDTPSLPVEFTGQGSPLAFTREPQYWLHDRAQGPRRAGVSAMSVDGHCIHVVLEEGDSSSNLQPLGERGRAFFAVEGETEEDLAGQLEGLATLVENSHQESLESVSRQWFEFHSYTGEPPLAMALVSRDRNDLAGQIEKARTSLETGTLDEATLSRQRIFTTANPQGPRGQVAFVFPGSGNHFPGMGRQLAVEWPTILRSHQDEYQHLRSQCVPEYIWNDRVDLDDHWQELIFAQVTQGIFHSDLARHFSIEPEAVMSYSLGESAGYFSLRVWRDRDDMWHRIQDSTLFTTDLAGPCTSVASSWNLAEGEEVDWLMGVVDRSAGEVETITGRRDRVYLLIVNTHRECVIGGQRSAVEDVVNELGANFFPLPGITTVHCEVMEPVAQAYRDLHLFDVHVPEGVDFYSSAAGTVHEVTTESAADSILTQARRGFDFTQVVEEAYRRGVRTFLEMGPGQSCSRFISDILGDRPHLATSICYPGPDPVEVFMSFLGQVVAHRVKVDLAPLFGPLSHTEKPSSRTLSVSVGRDPLRSISQPIRESTPQTTMTSPQPDTRPRSVPAPPPVPSPPVTSTSPGPLPAPSPLSPMSGDLMAQVAASEQARGEAHSTYLRLVQNATANMAQVVERQLALLQEGVPLPTTSHRGEEAYRRPVSPRDKLALYPRSQCMEIAVGKISNVFGPDFAPVDGYPTRVRLPDEPLMLVDRIMEIEGEPRSLGSGRVVTEHDVLADAWYLDHRVVPVCIAVESGQADLLLSGYLGIDFETEGKAVYRLLDAEVTFHRDLPQPGDVIRYDIHIDEFFRQDKTYLFRFRFESTVNGEPLLSMKKGCAGFFTDDDLAQGRGVVHTKLDLQPRPGKRPEDGSDLVEMSVESYSDSAIEALRQGDLAGCFGPAFADLPLARPSTLPGRLMKLLDRVVHLDPQGGRFGLGIIRSEADIHPNDWFLTCHFVDDMVMPGTLMYECCLHTFRIFLMRMGWVAEADRVSYHPVPGVSGELKCRGQVIPSTKKAAYEVEIKEIGYGPEPYAIGDALLYSDDKCVVKITNMSVRLKGLSRDDVESIWKGRSQVASHRVEEKTVLYDYDKILAFSQGNPSEAFGPEYKVFDRDRKIARLPRPPFQFLDRIVAVEGPPFVMEGGASCVAEYDVPVNEWYTRANGGQGMPFAVLLEIGLQPCGWLAAYMGSALTSEVDLSFRNLGGTATQYRSVEEGKTLTTRVVATSISQSVGMIIQHYSLEVLQEGETVYQGTTYFGFFTKEALADQVGIQDAKVYIPGEDEWSRGTTTAFPESEFLPREPMLMMDRVELLVADGGPCGLGFIQGVKEVVPDEWFFQAHFYQDPVWPGSLGLEAFLQLVRVMAAQRWNVSTSSVVETNQLRREHKWVYRGQVIPKDEKVTVQAWVTEVDDKEQVMVVDGYLMVDGRTIYHMEGFSLRITNS